MKLSEIKNIINEIVEEEINNQKEGVGYVYAKDRAKDPKAIPGERWRVKFESSKELNEFDVTDRDEEFRTAAYQILKKIPQEYFVEKLKLAKNDTLKATKIAMLEITGESFLDRHLNMLFWPTKRRFMEYLFKFLNQAMEEISKIEQIKLANKDVKQTGIVSPLEEPIIWKAPMKIARSTIKSAQASRHAEKYKKKRSKKGDTWQQRGGGDDDGVAVWQDVGEIKKIIKELIDEMWNSKNDVEGDETHINPTNK
jgi:hypothetical protein